MTHPLPYRVLSNYDSGILFSSFLDPYISYTRRSIFIHFHVVLNPFVEITERDAPRAVNQLFCEVEVGLEVHTVNYNFATIDNIMN